MRGFNMNDYNVRACVHSHLALHTLLTGDQFLSTISADASGLQSGAHHPSSGNINFDRAIVRSYEL
jgi:hypothetical protein